MQPALLVSKNISAKGPINKGESTCLEMQRVVEITVLSCNAGVSAKAKAEDKLRIMKHWQDGWDDVGTSMH